LNTRVPGNRGAKTDIGKSPILKGSDGDIKAQDYRGIGLCPLCDVQKTLRRWKLDLLACSCETVAAMYSVGSIRESEPQSPDSHCPIVVASSF
jgi:hypothetical protein